MSRSSISGFFRDAIFAPIKKSMGRVASAITWVRQRKQRKQLADKSIEISKLIDVGKYDEAVAVYRGLIAGEEVADQIYSVAWRWSKGGALADDFHQACVQSLKSDELRAMICSVASGAPLYQPSQFWLYYAIYHSLQIDIWGVDNFKRTVNNGYYNWTDDYTLNEICSQIRCHLGLSRQYVRDISCDFDSGAKPEKFSDQKWLQYASFVCLLYKYAKRHDSHGLFAFVSEGKLGNPSGVTCERQFVTQDLCNSIIELNTVLEVAKFDLKAPLRVMELGAGHGRVMYSILCCFPKSQIVIVDIPPALYVSQWYLTGSFPGLKAFKFREFDAYEQVSSEFESSRLAFLTPEQIERIPGKSIDLFVNISSLHEMKASQIQNWFNQIDRVCRGWFYTKQFIEYPNLIDKLVVRKNDYPVNDKWQVAMDRTNPIFPRFFESMYWIGH